MSDAAPVVLPVRRAPWFVLLYVPLLPLSRPSRPIFVVVTALLLVLFVAVRRSGGHRLDAKGVRPYARLRTVPWSRIEAVETRHRPVWLGRVQLRTGKGWPRTVRLVETDVDAWHTTDAARRRSRTTFVDEN